MKAPAQIWRQPGMISSLSVEWRTPQSLFAVLDAEFGFAVDVCPMEGKPLRADLGQVEGDALAAASWGPGPVWMNPPYGKSIAHWLARAVREAAAGVTVVALVPARTDTSWWHDYVMGREIRFLRGRLAFRRNDSTSGRCPFPSAIVVFHRPTMIIEARSADALALMDRLAAAHNAAVARTEAPRPGIVARLRSLWVKGWGL